MSLPIECMTTLGHPRYLETWIRFFKLLTWVMKLRDKLTEGQQNKITDRFLATAGCKAIQKGSTMPNPRNLEELTNKEISEEIKRNIRPKKKLVFTERQIF